MIIVEVEKNNIERALKEYRYKVFKTRQMDNIRERQQFTKKSVRLRNQKLKAMYRNKKTLEE